MYKQNSDRDLATGLVAAALGAGVVTSFAVAQGQSPFLALGITLFSAGAAIVLERYLRCS